MPQIEVHVQQMMHIFLQDSNISYKIFYTKSAWNYIPTLQHLHYKEVQIVRHPSSQNQSLVKFLTFRA